MSPGGELMLGAEVALAGGEVARRSTMVALTVAALVIYLINPDRLPRQSFEDASSDVGHSWSLIEAHVPAESPQLTSDEVTVRERAAIQPRGVEQRGGSLLLGRAGPVDSGVRAIGRFVRWRVPVALRPDVGVLQILRC